MRKPRLLIFVLVAFSIAMGNGSFFVYKWSQDRKGHPEVRVAEGRAEVSKLPHYLAKDRSNYKEQGIGIKHVECRDDMGALACLEAGKADIALVSPASLIYKKASDLEQGKEMVSFACLDRGTSYHLVAREDIPVNDIKLLKNKIVIAGPPNSTETVFFEQTLRDSGVNPYESVTIITNIPEEIKIGVFKSGTGQFLLLEEKDLPVALARGFYRVKSFRAEFPSTVCVTTRDFIKGNPQLLQKFTNGIYLAQLWMKHHTPAETAAACSPRGFEKEAYNGMVESIYNGGSLSESPAPQEKQLETVVKMLEKSKEIPMPVDAKELVYNQFAMSAVSTVKYVPADDNPSLLKCLQFWK